MPELWESPARLLLSELRENPMLVLVTEQKNPDPALVLELEENPTLQILRNFEKASTRFKPSIHFRSSTLQKNLQNPRRKT
ncbi:hypothetical protein KI387_038458, partial [Taxus chinensis]